jgi:hypothetical protein
VTTGAEQHQGPYLVGIDCGTQSAKVVVYDARGAPSPRSAAAAADVAPAPRCGAAPRRRPVDRDGCGRPARRWRRSTATRPRSSASGCARSAAARRSSMPTARLVEPVMSWMDERAYRPYLPDDQRLAYATTASGYLAHRFTGRASDTARTTSTAVADRRRHLEVERRPRAYERHGVAREQLFELQMPGEVIGPLTAEAATATGLPAGVPVVHTANDKAVEMLGSGSLGDAPRWCRSAPTSPAMVHGPDQPPGAAGTSGPTSPACRTATSTRAAACVVACGRSPGSSTCSARARRTGRDARPVARGVPRARGGRGAGRQRRADDRARLAGHRPTSRSARDDARLRRPPHARPRVPLDHGGDRADA